jgi:hypothetical protein
MGKGSSILAIFALLFGLGATGYIVYDNFIATPTTQTTPTENQWYDYFVSPTYIPSGESWGTLSSITIDFNTTSGQKAYFQFIGLVNFDDSSTPTSYIEMIFCLDGVNLIYPRIYVRRYNLDSSEGYRMSVSLQHYNNTMTAGNHTIEMLYRGDSTSDSVSEGSLFIQTFN